MKCNKIDTSIKFINIYYIKYTCISVCVLNDT